MFRFIVTLSCLLLNMRSYAQEVRLSNSEHSHYNGVAESVSLRNKEKVENYLYALRARVVIGRTYGRNVTEMTNSEWQDFFKWLVNTAGMGFTPQTDLPRLRAAFETFIKLCDTDKKSFEVATSLLVGISVKYLSYAVCEWTVPMPVSMAACPLIYSPAGYMVGKVAGTYLGRIYYSESCEQ